MKNLGIIVISFFMTLQVLGQSSEEAKLLLDIVATKMEGYENMEIKFSQTLVNEDAGINEGDEPPIIGEITLQQEKYNLDYLGNTFLFNGFTMYVINEEEKEVTVSKGDIDGEDGFIYPSKLATFYKEGYTYAMGKIKQKNGRNLQFVNLFPIDNASNIVKVELAIDLKMNHIYQLIQTGENGSKTTFTITTFKPNQKLSENLFSFDTKKYSEKNGYTID
ncbi:outer membrane lipoprotein carrier protein LolA [Polaribacter sp.]|jgi:outer membrane lipoprotein-sorting protein|nr:outer membrane lipoprotein carrier protein LolA [Polaribacter sp.]|tara:strand:+ start:562 stop:1221 length:660 start_codon:yes stop_codon:yes gene_type:complete